MKASRRCNEGVMTDAAVTLPLRRNARARNREGMMSAVSLLPCIACVDALRRRRFPIRAHGLEYELYKESNSSSLDWELGLRAERRKLVESWPCLRAVQEQENADARRPNETVILWHGMHYDGMSCRKDSLGCILAYMRLKPRLSKCLFR